MTPGSYSKLVLSDDGTLVMSTPGRSQKIRNLRRDPRIALCVGEGGCSVSLSGRVAICEDQALVRQDLERLIERYVKDESRRPQLVAARLQLAPVALHFQSEKVTEFFGSTRSPRKSELIPQSLMERE